MRFTVWSDGWMRIGETTARCALGRGGLIAAAHKREGDGATPIGVWPLRRLLYRPDKPRPPSGALPWAPIRPQDGWCDAPEDPAYNRPVTVPYAASAERMWRDDHLYDLVVVLGHNDDPPRAGAGSAIFLHLAREDYAPTQGCVALARRDLERLIALAGPGDQLEVLASRRP